MKQQRINKIKYLRIKNNYTQKQMCEFLLMKQSNYSKYENGKIPLNLELAKCFAKVFKISLSYLLEDEDYILINKKDFNKLVEASEVINNLNKL